MAAGIVMGHHVGSIPNYVYFLITNSVLRCQMELRFDTEFYIALLLMLILSGKLLNLKKKKTAILNSPIF